MHARSPNRLSTTDPLTSSECAAKSLFPNISDVSPCDSGFCPDSTLSPSIKCLRMNILATSTKKCGGESEAKSLFQNILAVSPCGSRFCADKSRSQPSKSLRMNILWITKKKNVAALSLFRSASQRRRSDSQHCHSDRSRSVRDGGVEEPAFSLREPNPRRRL